MTETQVCVRKDLTASKCVVKDAGERLIRFVTRDVPKFMGHQGKIIQGARCDCHSTSCMTDKTIHYMSAKQT